MNVRLVDTTLREGAQAPVRYLTHDQKVDVVRALARIGIEEIELGHAVTVIGSVKVVVIVPPATSVTSGLSNDEATLPLAGL